MVEDGGGGGRGFSIRRAPDGVVGLLSLEGDSLYLGYPRLESLLNPSLLAVSRLFAEIRCEGKSQILYSLPA